MSPKKVLLPTQFSSYAARPISFGATQLTRFVQKDKLVLKLKHRIKAKNAGDNLWEHEEQFEGHVQ